MLRKLVLALVAACLLTSCAAIKQATNPDTPAVVLQAQETAEQVVMGFQAAFKVTPSIVDALLKNGTITPHTYNAEILPAYNRGLTSLGVVVSALKAANDAKQDPNQSPQYISALKNFLFDKEMVDNMLAAFGRGGDK